MFSAHFEDALLSASDEELHNFFAELPLAARRRLIAVLAEVDAASAQHFLDTNRLDDDADLADLQWPSDPEQPSVRQPSPAPSESSSDVSLASWGIFGRPVEPAEGAVFGAVARPPGLVTVFSWNTNENYGLDWMLLSPYSRRTRTELWFGPWMLYSHRILLEHERNYGLNWML